MSIHTNLHSLPSRMGSRLKAWSCARLASTCLAASAVLMAAHARAFDVIDPTGANYGNVSDNSSYDGSYTSANLFNEDVTGVPVGTVLSSSEYARSGTGDCFVAFQLDTAYTNVASIFYAQRSGSTPTLDKIGIISLWSSTTTPFSAADPGTAPDSVVAITNTSGGKWIEYALTNIVSGQYFLVKLQQTAVGGNPGGKELRLGAQLGLAPSFVQAPVNRTVYSGGTATLSATATGTAPITYTWSLGGNPLSDGPRITGSGTGTLVISGVVPGDAGNYTLTISNAWGKTSAGATLGVITPPSNAAETAVISKNPLAFWQLNEASGSTVAYDYVGTHDGTYGGNSGVGSPGPQSPSFPGFSAANAAVQTYAYTADSAVTVPAMNVSTTNSVTILAWIYADNSGGPQQPYTGIVFCRGGGTAAGLICSADGTQLAYQWGGNRYNFNSGLVIPPNQWTLVAMVYTPTFTTLYCGSTNGVVLSAVDSFTQGGQPFSAPTMIGLDTDVGESARTFNGSIDDVAFFNRALTGSEINSIYAAGTGIVPTLTIVSQSATNLNIFQSQPFSLSVLVSGLNPAYQWYRQGALIAGATNSAYSVASAKLSDAGNYYVVVSNQVNTATSAVYSVSVPSYALVTIGASGALYTGISASSAYNDPNYAATGMFDSDLTGVPLGAQLTGKDWADDGPGNSYGPAYLAFQLDQAYTVNAVLYAQRNSRSGETIDKITSLSLWASQTTAFTAADPGTAPDDTVSVPDLDGAVLHAYPLTNAVTGKYFLVQVAQDPTVNNSNIGGNEIRLAAYVTPVPLAYSHSAAGLTLTWPALATLQQASDVTGPWVTAVGVTNGLPVQPTAGKLFYRILY